MYRQEALAKLFFTSVTQIGALTKYACLFLRDFEPRNTPLLAETSRSQIS